MLHKEPNKLVSSKGIVKKIVVAEILLALGSYAVWRCMNRSRNCRYYMYQNYPIVLEGYYTICERSCGSREMRLLDLLAWEKQGNEQH